MKTFCHNPVLGTIDSWYKDPRKL